MMKYRWYWFYFLLISLNGAYGQVANPVFIPDTISGNSIQLRMHMDSVAWLPGKKTRTLAYNQYNYMGPTLRLRKGQTVSLQVVNEIGDTTNVHWHGLHVASENDGGPHTMVMPGMDWNPQFTVLDKASNYWYHPHFHGKTAEQAMKGAIGMLQITDSVESGLAIPKLYGIDDFPIVVQTAQLDSNNQFLPKGMEDSLLFINGTRGNYGHTAFLNVPAQIVRLRLLNGAGERTFNIGMTNNRPFNVIASDGGFLSAPLTVTRLRMSPGERYQILVDASTLQGQSIQLMSYASELPSGVQGGPTMPMPPGNPPMDSPINGLDFNLLQLNVVLPTANPVTSVPATLTEVHVIPETEAAATRIIRFTAENQMVMDGPFFFNDSTFNMDRIDYRIPVNSAEIWELRNQTMVAHPFHVHLVQFNILERDGNPAPLVERGRKDVVMVESQETVKFIARFETFTDTMVPYMFHCHILMHEDDGMMGQFLVVPNATTSIKHLAHSQDVLEVFPNPVGESLTLNLALASTDEMPDYQIFNSMGQIAEHKTLGKSKSISVDHFPPGIYQIRVIADGKIHTSNFIKN